MTTARRVSTGAVAALVVLALLAIAPAPAGATGPNADAGSEAGPAAGLVDRFIVDFADGSPQDRSSAAAEDEVDEAAATVDADAAVGGKTAAGTTLVQLDKALDATEVETFVDELASSGAVDGVEVDLLMQADVDDPLFPSQWHYNESPGGIDLDIAWASNMGAGVTVAVLDTGHTSHPDLDDRLVGGYDFIHDSFVSRDGDGRDPDFSDEGDWHGTECGTPSADSSWHGTHVAGTVLATADNATGGTGVAPDANLVVGRVLGRCGGYTSDIADAVVWAAGGAVPGVPSNDNPAQVINLSLGGSGSCGTTMQSAIDTANALGAVVVVSAGNSTADAAGFSPASCNGVLTVAATNRAGDRAFYSNFGATVELAAPGGGSGGGVLSTLNDGTTVPGSPTYAYYQGTSMAAPHVAGVAALIASADPTMSSFDIRQHIIDTTVAFPGTCNQCGAGLLNAGTALSGITPPEPPGPPSEPNPLPPAGTHEATPNQAIPDEGSLESFIDVPGTGPGPSSLPVDVQIAHTFRGDIVLTLFAPDGTAYTLKSADGGDSIDDVRETFFVNASGVEAGGQWRLLVQDVFSGDVGTLESWNLQFPPRNPPPGGAPISGPSPNPGGAPTAERTAAEDVGWPIREQRNTTSLLDVDLSGVAGEKVRVDVNIAHQRRGDVRIDLITPDGKVRRLKWHDRTDVGTDIVESYVVDLSGVELDGTWRLRVKDMYPGKTGRINDWSLQF